jgi:hypothetical protein
MSVAAIWFFGGAAFLILLGVMLFIGLGFGTNERRRRDDVAFLDDDPPELTRSGRGGLEARDRGIDQGITAMSCNPLPEARGVAGADKGGEARPAS